MQWAFSVSVGEELKTRVQRTCTKLGKENQRRENRKKDILQFKRVGCVHR